MSENLIIAHTPEEALNAKTKDNVFIAGGTEVMRLGSPVSAESFISVRKVPSMHHISSDDGILTIGASCTFQELIDSELVPGYLKDALNFLASRTRRNMATIGGNIAVCRDDSFLIPTLIAACAVVTVADIDGSAETVSVEEYVTGHDHYEGRLITEISLPADDIPIKSYRSANTAQSHARLTVAMSLDGGKYKAAAAVKNVGILVLDNITSAFSKASDLTEEDIIGLVRNEVNGRFEDDLLYGSAAYREYLLGVTLSIMYEELNGKGGHVK